MRYFFIICILLFSSWTVSAQSDLLVLKKNGRTIETFFPGSQIYFSTIDRDYNAYVTSIQRDSIFLVQYDIRKQYTNLGVYVLDTVGQYRYGVGYKQVTGFLKERSNFVSGSGGALMGGGVVLATAGLATWVLAKPDTRYYARPELVIVAAALAGVGYLMTRVGGKTMHLGRKYSLHYIKVK